MKNIPLLIAIGAIATACSTRELDTVTENTFRVVAYPITAPANAMNQAVPVSRTTTYTYWKPVPGTNTYEPYVTKKPLTEAEQNALGIK